MAVICITGSTDGIGLSAARLLLAEGHRVLVHARNEARGRPVLDALQGDVGLVVGDLADLDAVRALADAVDGVDVLVHNAGVWAQPGAARSAQGFEPTFAVNVLAPHLLTALLAERVRERLVFLGSGMARSGHADPDALGAAIEPRRAYADSKALDVLLGLGWGRRLPSIRSGAVDPGWVKTKLASPGAPGEVEAGGRRVAAAAAAPEWAGGYGTGTRTAPVPPALTDPGLQDRVLERLDALAGLPR